MSRILLLSLAAGVLGTTYGVVVRGYPWILALMLGAAVGALAYSIQRASQRIREGSRRDFEPPD